MGEVGHRVTQAMISHYARAVAESRADVGEAAESKLRGISLAWVLRRFPVLASRKMGLDDVAQLASKSFRELYPAVAVGETGFGYGKLCPRDGLENCSIVDAVHAGGHSARATRYISWVWGYTVDEVTSALRRWASGGEERQAGSLFLWWDFFANNQYRLGPEADLAATTSARLRQIGSMLVVVERPEAPAYPTRLWCLFEAHCAGLAGVPLEVAIAESGWRELAAVEDRALPALRRGLAVDARSASATSGEDEARLRRAIEALAPDAVNQGVLLALQGLFGRLCETVKEAEVAPIAAAVESWADLHDRLSPRKDRPRGPEDLHLEIAAWAEEEAAKAERPAALGAAAFGGAPPLSSIGSSWQPSAQPLDAGELVRPSRPTLFEALQLGQEQATKDHSRLASMGGSLRPAALCGEESDGDVSPYNSAFQAMLCYAMLCYAMLCNAMQFYALLCYAMLYYIILYCTILYYTILYHTIPYHTILYYTIL